ncbi:NAD-dependent epimerase/dehydratase family protein [Portibacter lacus]|uniref:NAD-dependent epimerase n=1 Tax=Portibacter lacus TaxID=1099794 RepID=A0AA37WCT6_9BACT|nr:NAD-dependent epimerase/dehydratase family protein [Portibacter lacus]GLR16856.1 NAD-dependent epimerase [Portibacter lacus]
MHIDNTDKIAITGGTGFLGSHIIRGLVEKGYSNIYALKRENSDLTLLSDIKDKIHWVEGDLLDIISLEELIQDAVYVIHSAAKVSYVPRDEEVVRKINVEGTFNVVNVCLEFKPKKLMFISSVAAIGRAKLDKLISEKTEWSEESFSTNYAVSKHMAELEIWRGKTEGLDVGIVNPSFILGPSFWGDSSTKLFTYVDQEKTFYPIGTNGFVDVRDVAKLTILYMESEVKNKRVIAVGTSMAYKDLLEKIAVKMEVKPPRKPLRKGLASFVSKLSAFKKNPTITKETVLITSGQFRYDNSLSKELFDYQYYNIDQSVEDTVRKFRESKAGKKSFAYFERIFD